MMFVERALAARRTSETTLTKCAGHSVGNVGWDAGVVWRGKDDGTRAAQRSFNSRSRGDRLRRRFGGGLRRRRNCDQGQGA